MGVSIGVVLALISAAYVWRRGNRASGATQDDEYHKPELDGSGMPSEKGKDGMAHEVPAEERMPPQEMMGSVPEPQELDAGGTDGRRGLYEGT